MPDSSDMQSHCHNIHRPCFHCKQQESACCAPIHGAHVPIHDSHARLKIYGSGELYRPCSPSSRHPPIMVLNCIFHHHQVERSISDPRPPPLTFCITVNCRHLIEPAFRFPPNRPYIRTFPTAYYDLLPSSAGSSLPPSSAILKIHPPFLPLLVTRPSILSSFKQLLRAEVFKYPSPRSSRFLLPVMSW